MRSPANQAVQKHVTFCPREHLGREGRWASYIFKTLLDVCFRHQTWQVLFLWKKRQRGTSTGDDLDASPRLWAWSFFQYHPLAWASCVAYLRERQPRPDDEVSKSKTPTSFFVSVRKGLRRTFMENRSNCETASNICNRHRDRTLVSRVRLFENAKTDLRFSQFRNGTIVKND